jgi:hypothetical protein
MIPVLLSGNDRLKDERLCWTRLSPLLPQPAEGVRAARHAVLRVSGLSHSIADRRTKWRRACLDRVQAHTELRVACPFASHPR